MAKNLFFSYIWTILPCTVMEQNCFRKAFIVYQTSCLVIKEDSFFYPRLLVEWNIANIFGPIKTFREGIEFRVSEFKMHNFI